MTKQHFEELALAFQRERPGSNWDANKRVQWNQDVKAVFEVCRKFNPGADWGRFEHACGGLHLFNSGLDE